MRREVNDLLGLGPLPSFKSADFEKVQAIEKALLSIERPVSDDEARALIKMFGPDDCFELEWLLIHLIESAPGWPLYDCLDSIDNEWVQLLRTRINYAASTGRQIHGKIPRAC